MGCSEVSAARVVIMNHVQRVMESEITAVLTVEKTPGQAQLASKAPTKSLWKYPDV